LAQTGGGGGALACALRLLVMSGSPSTRDEGLLAVPLGLQNFFPALPFFSSYSLIAFKNKCTVTASRERPFQLGRSEAASFSSASMPAVERRERRCARFVLLGPMAVLAMEAGAGAFVFVGPPDFPPGRNKRKAGGDENAGDGSFLCPAGRERACQRSRYRTVSLTVTSLNVRSRSARTFQFVFATSSDELRADLGDQP
jgi:hypothetical protein